MKTTSGTIRRAAGLAVALALVAGSCGSAHAENVPDVARVRAAIMFVGDSNVGFALTQIGFDLTQEDAPFMVVDVARSGISLRSPDCAHCPNDFWKVRLAQALQRVSPDGFVIDLGVNDTVSPGTPTSKGYAAYAAKIDWLMRLLPASKPVWWTNLPCRIEPAERAVGCAAVNAALAAAAHRWRNLTILDWASTADAHPSYLRRNLDGIHLSPAGAQAWAGLVSRALNSRFPG